MAELRVMKLHSQTKVLSNSWVIGIINPRRACTGDLRYLCTCVRVWVRFVCLSVTTPAPTSLVSTLKMSRLFSVFNVWNFDKSFRSEVMA